MLKSGFKIILSIVLLGTALVLGFDYGIHYLVNNKLVDIINYQSPNRLYDYTFSNAQLHIWKGDLEVHDVNIIPRKRIIDSLASKGQHKRIILQGSLNTLELKNLNIWRLIAHQEISIDSFILQQPSINIHLNTKVKGDTSSTFTKDLISHTLSYGKINFFSLENATIKWIGVDQDSSTYFSCDSVSLLIENLYTDSIILKQKEPLVFTELLFKGSHFNVSAIKNFSLKSRHINYCYSKNELHLEGIVFRNILDKLAFTKTQRYEKEWYHVAVERITLSSRNTLHWVEGGFLNINKISIDQPRLFVYKDKRLADPPFIEKHLPSYGIRNIPIPLLIDTIEIHRGAIHYEEIVESGKKPGEVFFTQLNLKSYHLTNIDSLLSKHPFFEVNASTYFLGKAPIVATFKFPVQNKSDKFYAKGSIKHIDATVLNKLLTNMVFVEFQKGYIHSLSFNLIADKDSAVGTLDAHYTDLKVSLLDTTELFNNDQHKNKKMMGVAVNGLLRKNNIPGSKHYIQGHIHALRPKNKSIFNYLWTSVKSGLISTVINPKLYNKMMKMKARKARKEKKRAQKRKTSF